MHNVTHCHIDASMSKPELGNGHIDASKHDGIDYFQWLDNQPSGSVLYITEGSFL